MRPAVPHGKVAASRVRQNLQAAQHVAKQQQSTEPMNLYWQALEDTFVFAGPLGEVVGEVQAGTVVRECKRMQDDFGGWWIATRAERDAASHEDNDEGNGITGSLLWVSFNASQTAPTAAVDALAPSWVKVHPENEPPAQRGNSASSTKLASASASSTTLRRGGAMGGTPSDGKAGPAHRQGSADAARSHPRLPPLAAASTSQPSRTEESRAHAPLDPIGDPIVSHCAEAVASTVRHTVALSEVAAFVDGRVPGVPSELDLIRYYWSTVNASSTEEQLRDTWNHRYNVALENALFHTRGTDMESVRRAQHRLQTLLDDFSRLAQQLAVTVVERMLAAPVTPTATPAPYASTTAFSTVSVTPHPDFPSTVYFGDGVVVRICCDTPDGFFEGDMAAQKYAMHRFKAAQLLSYVGARRLLYVPLVALVDFEGHHMTVSAIPPIGTEDSCIYSRLARPGTKGSLDTPPAFVNRLLTDLAVKLYAPAREAESTAAVDRDASGTLCPTAADLPVELEAHIGRDRRVYLFNYDRVASLLQVDLHNEARERWRRRSYKDLVMNSFRPELVLGYHGGAVNVNTGVQDAIRPGDVANLEARLDYLKTDAITACAGMIGMLLPLPKCLQLPECTCNRCNASIAAEELRFLVCRSPQACCHICTNCYTGIIMEYSKGSTSHPRAPQGVPEGGHDDGGSKRVDEENIFKSAVKCWHSQDGPRPLSSVLMEPTVSDILHANGVPVHYLGYVYNRLPTASHAFTARYVQIEMVGRAAARLLRSALRGAATAEDSRNVIEGFLSVLLQNAGPKSERMWARDVGPTLEKMFPGIGEPFSTKHMSRELLLTRVASLMGVVFTSASVSSFGKTYDGPSRAGEDLLSSSTLQPQNGPFLQLHSVNPRVKLSASSAVLSLSKKSASLVEEQARTDISQLHALLEAALLFWIGYTPENALETLQPLYLEKVMSSAAAEGSAKHS